MADLTNAQVALLAAVKYSNDGINAGTTKVTVRADDFLAWLDKQDNERNARARRL